MPLVNAAFTWREKKGISNALLIVDDLLKILVQENYPVYMNYMYLDFWGLTLYMYSHSQKSHNTLHPLPLLRYSPSGINSLIS